MRPSCRELPSSPPDLLCVCGNCRNERHTQTILGKRLNDRIYTPCNPRLIRRLPPPRAIAKALRPHFGRSAFMIANSQLISARTDLWLTFAAQTRTPRASHGRLQASRRADSPRIGFMARTRAASSRRKSVFRLHGADRPTPQRFPINANPGARRDFWMRSVLFWRLRASGGCGFPD